MKNLRIILVALLAFSPMMAQADLVEVTGTDSSDGWWDIQLVYGSFYDIYDVLDDQEWWGDSDLAGAFAAALGASWPGPNAFTLLGPYFAYDVYKGKFGAIVGVRTAGTITGHIWDIPVSGNGHHTYAIATKVPEPGTLALLGLGLAGIGLARRRKQA